MNDFGIVLFAIAAFGTVGLAVVIIADVWLINRRNRIARDAHNQWLREQRTRYTDPRMGGEEIKGY